MTTKIQTVRPFEERIKTGVYNWPELQMITKQVGYVEAQVDPWLRASLHKLTIKDADTLMNGAPN